MGTIAFFYEDTMQYIAEALFVESCHDYIESIGGDIDSVELTGCYDCEYAEECLIAVY